MQTLWSSQRSDRSDRLKVVLVQLPVPNNPTLNVPLAAGYLKAFAAAQGLLRQVEIEILPRALADRAGDAALVEALAARRPDVLGFSLYTWNSERSLQIAARVKERLPGLRVLVGGPEVQRDNAWVLEHPAVDVAVLGEGEQTFAELLALWADLPAATSPDFGRPSSHIFPLHTAGGGSPRSLSEIAGIAYHDDGGLRVTPDRVALADLGVVPSPYTSGWLELSPDSMAMVEVSRWCPYACSFCLYGRNMGAKLGNRYFGLERVLAEVAWARERGVRRVHFVEANLNLVPLFWPLMRALAELNADRQMTFYAELRGEHLTDEVVAALDRANVRVVEVGLQTANPVALRASHRRTDLGKWAAGTRRLYERDIEVYLDVILGLPADDAGGVAATIDFIASEQLGPYDVFTLQVLPGTAVRAQADAYGLRFQDRPPYYVLGSDQFSFDELRRLRRELKQAAALDPDAIEGLPPPRSTALSAVVDEGAGMVVEGLDLTKRVAPYDLAEYSTRLGLHVDLVMRANDLAAVIDVLADWIALNPSTIFDLYLLCDDLPPAPEAVAAWRSSLPFVPGYLDRVAAYAGDGAPQRISPRCLLVLPWTAAVDPEQYRGVAEVIWHFELAAGEAIPFGAWRAAGGRGIALHGAGELSAAEQATMLAELAQWQDATGRAVWMLDDACLAPVAAEASVYTGRI